MTQWLIPVVGGLERRGHWRLAERTVFVSLLGSADLDLTEAEVPEGGATFIKISVLGDLKIVAPPTINVDVAVAVGIGERKLDGGAATPGAPTVRVKAYSIFGGVTVRRSPG